MDPMPAGRRSAARLLVDGFLCALVVGGLVWIALQLGPGGPHRSVGVAAAAPAAPPPTTTTKTATTTGAPTPDTRLEAAICARIAPGSVPLDPKHLPPPIVWAAPGQCMLVGAPPIGPPPTGAVDTSPTTDTIAGPAPSAGASRSSFAPTRRLSAAR